MHIRRSFTSALLVVMLACSAGAQPPVPPRLVVVITIDQFPYEYLVRFGPWFGSGGFRRLMTGGANFTHATYKHAVTLTGPGHAVILSGTYGDLNGIIGNSWYDIATHKPVYCVDDSTVAIVGGRGGGKSPSNFIGSTYGDELLLTNGFRSKAIAISVKDRAAVLTGGKLASGVYWFSDSAFVTSTYYMKELPGWVRAFNGSGAVHAFLGRVWRHGLPEGAFAGIDADDVPYEDGGNGMGRAFPHPISKREALLTSPYGDMVLSLFAKAAVRGEKLGARGVTDLLAVSFSSTDYVGHAFGPHSREALAMAVATDSTLADFLRFLDAEVGAGSYIVALTSDHGVAPIPEYILKQRPGTDAGRIPSDSIAARCEFALTARWGPPSSGRKWIERTIDRNMYFRRSVLEEFHITPEDAALVAAPALAGLRGIAAVYTRGQIEHGASRTPLDDKAKKSYYALRSGDLIYMAKPYYFQDSGHDGTSHGEPYEYSAHVPLIILGAGIRPGVYAFEASPADLAPTLSAMTGVEFTAQAEGRVLIEALR